MKVYMLRSRLEHCNGEWLWETDSIPIHQCVWICFQNGNGNKKFISMEAKSHSHLDFDSSSLHDIVIHLYYHPIVIPVSSYQKHPNCI